MRKNRHGNQEKSLEIASKFEEESADILSSQVNELKEGHVNENDEQMQGSENHIIPMIQ